MQATSAGLFLSLLLKLSNKHGFWPCKWYIPPHQDFCKTLNADFPACNPAFYCCKTAFLGIRHLFFREVILCRFVTREPISGLCVCNTGCLWITSKHFFVTQSDITTELSTTIIQASPLPSQEPAVDRFREERPFQSRAKGALVYITQKSLGPEHVTETTSLNSRPERGKPRLRSSSELCSRSEDLSEASVLGVPSGPREEDRLSPALLSHPGLQPPAALRLPASRQAPVGAAGRGTPEDVSGGQGCHQMASAGGSAPETQPVAPTLTTQHPPPAPMPFAQPYPGTLPQSTMVCGCSGGCHPAITGEHIRSVAPMGICLGQSVGSGWMGAVSLCDLYPSAVSQSLLSTAKPFPAQAAATSCGIESWDSGAVTGFGKRLFLCCCLLITAV